MNHFDTCHLSLSRLRPRHRLPVAHADLRAPRVEAWALRLQLPRVPPLAAVRRFPLDALIGSPTELVSTLVHWVE